MPDKDWYDWHLPRYWRAVARGIEKGDSRSYAQEWRYFPIDPALLSASGWDSTRMSGS